MPDLKFRRAYSNVDREAVQAMFSQFDTNKVQPDRPTATHRIRSPSTHSSLFMPMRRPQPTPPRSPERLHHIGRIRAAAGEDRCRAAQGSVEARVRVQGRGQGQRTRRLNTPVSVA